MSVAEIVDAAAGGRVKRVKVLSDEQRVAINQLQHPVEMSRSERKRQFGVLARRMEKADARRGACKVGDGNHSYFEARNLLL